MTEALSVRHPGRSRQDRKVALAVATAFALFMAFAVSYMHPWGIEPSIPRTFDSYWSGVATANDFVSFWTGASLVRNGAGAAMYDMDLQHRFQADLRRNLFTGERLVERLDPFHNPPPLALLFLPLTLLPLSWAFLLWSAVSAAAFGVGAGMPMTKTGISWTALAAMIATGAVADALLWGQADAVFLVALSLGLMALADGRPFRGGLLIGLLWLKPQYAVVFPMVFLFKRRWRELAGMAVSGGVLALVSLMIIGVNGVALYVSVLQDVGSFYPPETSFIFPELMVNWRAMLINLWPGLPGDTGSTMVAALGAATLLASLLAWRGAYDPRSINFPLQVAVALLAAIVASPHSHLHSVSLLFAPVALGLARGTWSAKLGGSWRPLWIAGLALTWVGWLLPPLRWLLAPYFVAGMVVLSIPLLAQVGAEE